MTGKRCFVLNGMGKADGPGVRVRQVVVEELGRAGWAVDIADLEGLPLAPCRGCFTCWTTSPGVCGIDDAGRDLAARFIRSDLRIYLSPVVFGGYGSRVKAAQDRIALSTLQPFFQLVDDRTRHPRRYARPFALLGVGWLAGADPEQERLFRVLDGRLAENLHPERHGTCLLHGGQDEQTWRERLGKALAFGEEARTAAAPEVVLVDGSPKDTGGATGSLLAYLGSRLRDRGGKVQTFRVAEIQRDAARRNALCAAQEEAEALVVAFPLYADQPPGPVGETLEALAAWRQGRQPGKRQRLLALVNCGFPEPEHGDVALEICRLFAREAGFEWRGGCSVGGGGMYDAKPLEHFGVLSRRLRKELDRVAEAALDGQGRSLSVVRSMVPSALPRWLYHKIVDASWAKKVGPEGKGVDLQARPYLEPEDPLR